MNYVSVLIKPSSSLCNMRCSYCFYHSLSSIRQHSSYGMMTKETAEHLIDRVYAAKSAPFTACFTFQGGEPTLAGLPFFEHFAEYAAEKLPDGCHIRYAMQTNGLLINEEWCAFLKKQGFLVGLSLDGDKEIHDFLRHDAGGKGTYSRVFAASRLFDKIGVEYNVLTVVTRQLARRIRAVWNAFEKGGFRYLQFIPCLAPLDGSAPVDEKFSLSPQQYAAFLKESFALWADGIRHGKYISVRFFDNLILMVRGQLPEQCGMSGQCHFQFVTEADGSVFPCDFYCIDEYSCGNVNDMTLPEIESSSAAAAFLGNPFTPAPVCGTCRFAGVCGGGCKRYQTFYFENEGYCPQKDFLDSVYNDLLQIARLL